MAKDKEFQIAFGRHVRKLRDEKNWTQAQLASQANMNVNQISRLERGEHAPYMRTIRAIASALGKYPDELLRFDFNAQLNTDFSEHHQRSNRRETTSTIHKLVDTEFLKNPKSVTQIVAKCKSLFKVNLKSAATSGVLKKLVEQRVLKRVPSRIKGRYLYLKR